MGDYVFGLPENDPNYRPSEPNKSVEEQNQNDEFGQSSPPAPKVASDAAPLQDSEREDTESHPVVRNQNAIKRGAGHVPVTPPPNLQKPQPAPPEVASNAQAQVFSDALPPTAGKLPFFEPEPAPRRRKKLRTAEYEDEEIGDDSEESVTKPVRRSTTRPRRSLSNQFNSEKAEKAKQTIGDAVPIAQYYLSQVQKVLFSPAEFFEEMQDEAEFTEAAIFMAITLGVCAVMRLFCGDFWALVHFLGGVLIVAAASFGGTFVLKNMVPEKDVNFNTVFAIFCYSQAPKLIAWLSLGIIPIGYWVSNIWSLAICCIAFEKIFGMSKMKSGLIVSGLFAVAGCIAWVLHF